MEDPTSSSDRDEFVSLNLSAVTTGIGVSKSIDWNGTTISTAGTFGLGGGIVVKSNGSTVGELKNDITLELVHFFNLTKNYFY